MVLFSIISGFVGLGILQAIHLLRLGMLLEGDVWKLPGLASGHEMLSACTNTSVMKAKNI